MSSNAPSYTEKLPIYQETPDIHYDTFSDIVWDFPKKNADVQEVRGWLKRTYDCRGISQEHYDGLKDIPWTGKDLAKMSSRRINRELAPYMGIKVGQHASRQVGQVIGTAKITRMAVECGLYKKLDKIVEKEEKEQRNKGKKSWWKFWL